MINNNIKRAFDSTEKALKSLEIALNEPMLKSKLNIDGTIQRFEFSIEIFWKLLKRILAEQGVDAPFPRDVLQKAYAGKLIDDETIWLSMLRDRNQTSHTYDEELAEAIYIRIKTYYPILEKTCDFLKNTYYRD